MIIKNAKIILEGNQTRVCDLEIVDGKLSAIEDHLDGEVIYDAHENLVLSGGIDVHVHLREPGYTHKETIRTGTMAAAKGGYTTIMAMPNVIPYPDCVETLLPYMEKIKQDACVNVVPYACITKQEAGKEITDMKAISKLGLHAFSDDGVGVQCDEKMEEAMRLCEEVEGMIVAHTEDMKYRLAGACMHEGIRNQQLGWLGIPSECEWKQVERDLKLVEKTKCKYHVCHISSATTVELLKEARQKGLDVSGEVTAHHLVLNEMDVNGSNEKMNPPLRSDKDQRALIEALRKKDLDFVANDHAPHSEEEKAKPMNEAPFGIVALETSIPLLYTKLVEEEKFTLERFQEVISEAPAKRFGFTTKGKLAVGYDADLVVLDTEHEKTIDKNTFVSMGKNTPFHGYTCKGWPIMTMVNGTIRYQEEQ